MLKCGEVDAVTSTKVPLGVARASSKAARLFADYLPIKPGNCIGKHRS